MTLEEIKERCAQAPLPLKATATNIVFGKGNPNASIMFIGEAPGAKEDLQGMPFVGAAGKQLDRLLSLIDLTLEDVYIANILKYRPPGNRNPSMAEIRAHTPFLVEQIQCIRPKVIATLGNFSTKFVLAGFDPSKMKAIGGITSLHGSKQQIQVNTDIYTVVPLYHPAAMLYNPNLRASLDEDIRKMGELIEDH